MLSKMWALDRNHTDPIVWSSHESQKPIIMVFRGVNTIRLAKIQPEDTKWPSEDFKDQILREIDQGSHDSWRLGGLTPWPSMTTVHQCIMTGVFQKDWETPDSFGLFIFHIHRIEHHVTSFYLVIFERSWSTQDTIDPMSSKMRSCERERPFRGRFHSIFFWGREGGWRQAARGTETTLSQHFENRQKDSRFKKGKWVNPGSYWTRCMISNTNVKRGTGSELLPFYPVFRVQMDIWNLRVSFQMWLFDWDNATARFHTPLKHKYSRHHQFKFEASVIVQLLQIWETQDIAQLMTLIVIIWSLWIIDENSFKSPSQEWRKQEQKYSYSVTAIRSVASIYWLSLLEITSTNHEIRTSTLNARLFHWFRRICDFELCERVKPHQRNEWMNEWIEVQFVSCISVCNYEFWLKSESWMRDNESSWIIRSTRNGLSEQIFRFNTKMSWWDDFECQESHRKSLPQM
jgi:hypothetical protein